MRVRPHFLLEDLQDVLLVAAAVYYHDTAIARADNISRSNVAEVVTGTKVKVEAGVTNNLGNVFLLSDNVIIMQLYIRVWWYYYLSNKQSTTIM